MFDFLANLCYILVGKSITKSKFVRKSQFVIVRRINITDQHTSKDSKEEQISSYQDIHNFIFKKLAEIRLTDVAVLKNEAIQNGGDLEIDSEEGAAIAHGLGGAMNQNLVSQQDIKLENFNSTRNLTNLLYKNSLKKGTS